MAKILFQTITGSDKGWDVKMQIIKKWWIKKEGIRCGLVKLDCRRLMIRGIGMGLQKLKKYTDFLKQQTKGKEKFMEKEVMKHVPEYEKNKHGIILAENLLVM